MKYLPLLLLSGCSMMNTPYEQMSAEQIAALAKMKDANVACIIVNSPWGRGVSVFANVDRDVIQRGNLTVDTDCKVIYTNDRITGAGGTPAPQPVLSTQPSNVLAPLPVKTPAKPIP